LDAATQKVVYTLKEKGQYSTRLSNSGRRLLTHGSDGLIKVWDVEADQPIATFKVGEKLRHISFLDPDGLVIATVSEADEKAATIWSADSGKSVAVLGGHDGMVRSVAMSSDRLRYATGSRSGTKPGTARVWDAQTGNVVAIEMVPPDDVEQAVDGIAFSPDGRLLAMAFAETTRISRLISDSQNVTHGPKQVIRRCLTRDQRAAAFLDPDPPTWCIDMEKWPYETTEWKDWLKLKRAKLNPPHPYTKEWKEWLAAREATDGAAKQQ
jgi:WD40 repeat protein